MTDETSSDVNRRTFIEGIVPVPGLRQDFDVTAVQRGAELLRGA